ncbi:MAG: DNA alkylation repair protein [Candidatus Thorarchaeota archaeon]
MDSSVVELIHNEPSAASDAERKVKISGCIKTSNLAFIGVKLPDIHRIVKSHIKPLAPNELPVLMEEMWAIEAFETRLAAIDMMKVYAKKGSIENALTIVDECADEVEFGGVPLEDLL